MAYDIGFLMEQVAGHTTNYRNLRAAIEQEPATDIVPWWEELYYSHPGGTIERLQASLPFIPSYVTGNMRMAQSFRTALHKRPYDALFTNSWAAMLFAKRIRHIPTLIDLDSTPLLIDGLASYESPRDPAPVASLKFRLCQRAYRAARLIQAWSNWAKRSVVTDYGIPEDRVVVAAPGVDINFFSPTHDVSDGDTIRIAFIGADFARKGGCLLIDWYRQQRYANISLDLVTKERISAIPGVNTYSNIRPNTAELRAILQRADIFVLPSLAECFGLATVEAMACGVPVIVSDIGGTADIVTPGVNGFITRAGDPRDLSTALATLIADPYRRKQMGLQSRAIAVARFDSRIYALRTLTRLRELAADGFVQAN